MYLGKVETRQLCKELIDDSESLLSWKWDGGFKALLAEFSTDKQDEVRSVLERHLPMIWDDRSIRKAPKNLKAASGDLGDLRDKQLLFSNDPEGEPIIFAAWWPWGNGEVISVRIASPSSGERAEESPGFFARMMRIFG